MMIYQIAALTLLVTIPALAQAALNLLRLQRFGLNLADLALPTYGLALVLVSNTFFPNSFLPHYLAAMALLAIIVCLKLLHKSTDFSFRRFLKLFWRIGFFVTLLAYLLTLVTIFTLAS